MAALHILKFQHDLSDDDVVAAWVENPYWQFFSGMQFFSHQAPIDPSSMTRWRSRLGASGAESMLKGILETGLKINAIKPSDFERINVDTTVQTKAIRYPSDARLCDRVRERLAKDEQWQSVPKPKPPLEQPPDGLLGREEIRLMYDLMIAALQTDSTRVITYRLPISNLLSSLGVKVAAHDMSHYSQGERMEASQKRDVANADLLAGLIDKLKAVTECNGSRLFDQTTVAFGSNLSTGHNLTNCPMLLTGGGSGIKLGHHLVASKNTPLCNVWLTLLRRSGLALERHGDSSGELKELIA